MGYPETLNLDYNVDAPPRLPAGAQTEEVVRIRRLARFHSRNLIASAGTWEVPRSIDWELLFPAGDAPHGTPKIGEPASTVYSAQYRHLLNIRSGAFLDDDDEDGEYTRYKSLVDKEWHKFGELGFRDVEPGKLQFDLSEGERNRATSKRDTLDWVRDCSIDSLKSSSTVIYHADNELWYRALLLIPAFPEGTRFRLQILSFIKASTSKSRHGQRPSRTSIVD